MILLVRYGTAILLNFHNVSCSRVIHEYSYANFFKPNKKRRVDLSITIRVFTISTPIAFAEHRPKTYGLLTTITFRSVCARSLKPNINRVYITLPNLNVLWHSKSTIFVDVVKLIQLCWLYVRLSNAICRFREPRNSEQ